MRVGSPGGIGHVRDPVHVPAIRTEEAVACQAFDVAVFILEGEHTGVARHVRGLAARPEPAAVGAGECGSGRLFLPLRRPRPEQQLYSGPHIGLKPGTGGGEIFAVEQHVIPLGGGMRSLGIDRAVRQRNDRLWRKPVWNVGHTQRRHRMTAVGMLLGHRPDHRRAPVVADPDRLLGPQAVQQLDHIGDDFLLAVVRVPAIDAGSPITAHIRRDGPKPQAAEHRQLMAPRNRKLGPAVDEDDRRACLGSAGQIKGGVARASGHAFENGKGHAGVSGLVDSDVITANPWHQPYRLTLARRNAPASLSAIIRPGKARSPSIIAA